MPVLAISINYQVCQKSAPYFNAITNTKKNCLYWYKFIDYTVAIELLRRVSTLLFTPTLYSGFLAQLFTLANLPVFGVVLQVLM